MVVGSMVIPKYADPKIIYTPKDIQTDTLSEHGVNLTYMQAWRAKENALEFLRGHPVDSYSRLPSYLYILENTYPGSVVKLQKTEDDYFLYAFIALSTSIKGWEYCRTVVVVDGTFLKLAYMGIMLQLAQWMQQKMTHHGRNCLSNSNMRMVKKQTCVVSDQNESILNATSTVYTGMLHYICMWHIWTNVRSKFKKDHLKLSELYFVTAQSYILDKFNERMSQIEEIDTRVKAYLYDIGYHRSFWVLATANKTWTMTSNISKSLNAVTKDARELPVVKLLEYMRTLLKRWTNEKLLKVNGTFTYLGKKYNKELEDNMTLSQKMRVRAYTNHIHTVIDGVKLFIVCLQNKRCSCGQFQLDELPCAHALAALRHMNESYENYCSPYYSRESLLHTYEISVDSLPDESKWNVPQDIAEEVVMPPTGKRQSGRPQK
ncbi:uncharacterized protein [Nicotiana tomentosiformis]|uniref:uncharacterized protein n=1 Tax=Nicotiana tomentosiformis TaxID=4098 RepID=UPI00051ABDAD|nr:uncharacterized protein LOC104112883 [Nicotiana tomentosiformis]